MTLPAAACGPVRRGPRGALTAVMLLALVLVACAAQRAPALPPASLDPRPRAPHDLPGASIDLLVQPEYPVGAPVDVEIEIWSWGATIRGPLAAEVRASAGPDGAEVTRRLDAALVERWVPANGRGTLILVWDGRDDAGQLAPVGTYWIAVVFEIERAGRAPAREEVGSAVRLARP